MKRRVWLLTLFSAATVVWPIQAKEVGVKSLSGPPEEFAAHRLPSAAQVAVPTNILMVDRGTRIDEGLSRGATRSTFETSPGVGFTLVEVTTEYPYFAPATITSPSGSQYVFNGRAITCNAGPCGEYQADLTMEAFTRQAPGGVLTFSISGGEVKGGTWSLALQDPAAASMSSRALQVESVLSFDDNYLEVGVEPDPCGKALEEPCSSRANASDARGGRRTGAFDLVDGTAPVLRLSFANEEMQKNGSRSRVDVTALSVTITDSRTRNTLLQKKLGPSRADGFWVDESGTSLVALPALPAGLYSVRLDIKGRVKGVGQIERTAFYTLPIIDRTYEATGEARAKAIDRERVEILLGVEPMIEDRPHVYAYAEVWSRDGQKPIAWIGGMTQPRQDGSGKLGLPVLLDARWLALAGESGSDLLLRNIRIQDPDTFLPIDQIAELPVSVGKLPRAAFAAKAAVVKDDSLYMGRGDRTISVPGDAPVLNTKAGEATGILLVHGWCSNTTWPLWQFGLPGRIGGTEIFSDFGVSRSHDAFALEIRNQGHEHFSEAFTVVGHSQGGAAALHLRAFYTSRLDNSTAPRRIQSMGTPYGGSTLMDFYLGSGPLSEVITDIFGFCSPPQPDLGTVGSAFWSSSIPAFARDDVYYYRTGFQRPQNVWQRLQFWRWRCNAASFLIPGWDDGVVSVSQGLLAGAHSMGVTEGECHTPEMNHNPQTRNIGRNDVIDREGRPHLATTLVGVIRGSGSCGADMQEYSVYFDNEDHNNANGRSGWIGATQSDSNTLLRLCGTNGKQFETAALQGARFALVLLGDACPAGFTRLDRFHDNEDHNTQSWDTAPEGSPTDTVGSAKNTNMAFCVTTGSSTGVANSAFPNLGVPYGVFGGRLPSLSSWALDRGSIHMDDEDNNNQNSPDSPPAFALEFLEPGNNTTYYMARVK